MWPVDPLTNSRVLSSVLAFHFTLILKSTPLRLHPKWISLLLDQKCSTRLGNRILGVIRAMHNE